MSDPDYKGPPYTCIAKGCIGMRNVVHDRFLCQEHWDSLPQPVVAQVEVLLNSRANGRALAANKIMDYFWPI